MFPKLFIFTCTESTRQPPELFLNLNAQAPSLPAHSDCFGRFTQVAFFFFFLSLSPPPTFFSPSQFSKLTCVKRRMEKPGIPINSDCSELNHCHAHVCAVCVCEKEIVGEGEGQREKFASHECVAARWENPLSARAANDHVSPVTPLTSHSLACCTRGESI